MKTLSKLLLAAMVMAAGLGILADSTPADAGHHGPHHGHHHAVQYYTLYYRTGVYAPWVAYYTFTNPADAANYAYYIRYDYGYETYTYSWRM